MGWMIGVGLLLLALVGLSAISAVVATVRFVARDDSTPFIAYIGPAMATLIGILAFLIVRFAWLSSTLYDLIGFVTLGLLVFAIAIGLIARSPQMRQSDDG